MRGKRDTRGFTLLAKEMRRLQAPVVVYLLTSANRPPVTQANTATLSAILFDQSFQYWERGNGITAANPLGIPAISPPSVLARHLPRQVISSAISVLEFAGTGSTIG
jgi:hypothetical protein